MNVITLNAEKGGVTKTTQAIHIAAGLAQRGQRALLIDADPQGHSTWSLGLDRESGLYDLLVRPEKTSIADVVREVDPKFYASETPEGVLYVLPGNTETRSIYEHVEEVDVLKEQLERLDGSIDTVIIDTSPTPGMLMPIIYAATDCVIVPTQCEALSMQGMIATIQRAQKAETRVLGISPSIFQKATEIHRRNLKVLVEASQQRGWRLWQPIRQARRTVFSLLPKSDAAADAWRLVDRVEEALKSYA